MNHIQITLDLEVPTDELITEFLKETPEIQGKMIFLGHKLFTQCREQLQHWTQQDIEEKVLTLQHKLQKMEKETRDSRMVHKEEIETMSRELKERIYCSYKQELETLESKLKTTTTELEMIRTTTAEKHQRDLQEIRDQFDTKMDTIRKEYDEKLEVERNKHMSQVSHDNNSSIKGQSGEKYTYYELNRLFPKYEVKDCHQEAARGDFLVEGEQFTMMVEAKKYQKNVPLVEIEKFHRDMTLDSNKDIHCGVLISLDSGICGKEDFQIEFVGEKPVIYLHHTRECMEHIRLTWTLFCIMLRQDSLDMTLETATTAFKALMKKIKRNFNQQKKAIDKHHAEQLNMVVEQQTQIIELYKHMGLSIQF